MTYFSKFVMALVIAAKSSVLLAAPVNYQVAVIDRFYPPVINDSNPLDLSDSVALLGLADIDGDRHREPIFHGDLVTLIARHPQLSFIHYPLSGGARPTRDILTSLRELRLRHQRYPVDALLLCWESSTLISAFEDRLNPDHAGAYKRLIDYWGIEDAVWRDSAAIIEELEALVDEGVAVVTIAGNGGQRMVNVFSFAEGVITVGATESELRHFVADNPFVDRYAAAARFVRPLKDATGKTIGFDINDDNCADITAHSLSGRKLDEPRTRLLKGSSFAAPASLLEILPGLQQQSGCTIPVETAGPPAIAATEPG